MFDRVLQSVTKIIETHYIAKKKSYKNVRFAQRICSKIPRISPPPGLMLCQV